MFYCIFPYSWAHAGLVLSLVLSVVGAAVGVYLSGASILGSAIKTPRVKSKNLISIIFCEAVGIYGLVFTVLMNMSLKVYSPL